MAAKQNQKKNNKVKIYSKYGKSISWKRAAIFGAAFGLIGVVVLLKSFAASALHEYSYKSPGIGHTIGNAAVVDTTSGTQQVWEVIGGCGSQVGASCINGASMWFGPYADIPGHGHKLVACWTFLIPYTKSYTVSLDVSYNGARNFIHTPFNYTVNSSTLLSSYNIYTPITKCTSPMQLDGRDVYNNVEVRARPISGGSGSQGNAIKLLKTSWQLF